MVTAAMLEGLPPNNATRVLRFACSEAEAQRVADLVVEVFDPAETAAAAFEDGTHPSRTKPWLVEIYLGRDVAETDVRAFVEELLGSAAAATVAIEDVAEQDWVARSLAGLAPVRAGRFLVHGAHDRSRVRANDLALEVEAALAFGTGHHGTTRGCLLMADAVLKGRRPRRIADLGTGTGVLAMALARATHRPVACGDIDAVAVAAAGANAKNNGLGGLVRPVRAHGTSHPTLAAGAPYDLIFANILARPLRALARSIGRIAAPGADLVLSGLQPRDVPGVVSRYGSERFALVRRLEIEGWSTLRLRHRGAAMRS